MRHFYLGMICLMLGSPVLAQDEIRRPGILPKNEKKGPAAAVRRKPEVTLKVGNEPPVLKATKWVKGTEIKSFEKGKVYVVEFWATWCRDCVAMTPHLSELQKEYADKGVIIVGLSTKDVENTQSHVEEFVARRDAKFQYTFAFADNPATYERWVKAAGKRGIPCAFVIGKEGTIDYIGHPMFLGFILPKVAAGTWNTKTDGETIQAIEKETSLVLEKIDQLNYSAKNEDAEKGLKVIADFETNYPALSKNLAFVYPKINMMLEADKKNEVKIFAERVIEEAARREDSAMLEGVAHALVGPTAKNDKELADVALKAANKMFAIVGDQDLGGQITLAHVGFRAGEKELAKKHAEKVIELAPERSRASWKKALNYILAGTTDEPMR